MNNVIEWLEAYASGIGKQEPEITESFYNIAMHQLETQAERKAFHYGAVAITAAVAKKRIRAWWYERKCIKAMNELKGEI